MLAQYRFCFACMSILKVTLSILSEYRFHYNLARMPAFSTCCSSLDKYIDDAKKKQEK